MADPAVIRVFDTTLRDGEQSPGATMTTEEKLLVADQLVRLNVDVIEAGFPAASPGDLAAVKEIARYVCGPAVAALARAILPDIDAAWEAVREAEHPVLHLFIATSDIHLKHKLNISREEALQRIKAMVEYARRLCPTVEFSAEDATRTERDYLCRVCETAIRAGATIIDLPDTVGYMMPNEYGEMFRYVREHVSGIEDVTLSAHCHNDLGMATANMLAAVSAGVRQIEVTINGLGERAGDTAMEEVVMALYSRPDTFGDLTTNIDTREFVRASRLVSSLTGIPVQPNKAIVGANAFVHQAGIHQDGMLKNRQTYEFITPQSVGWNDRKLALGRNSGRHGLDARLRELGHHLSAHELKTAYRRFIVLADQQKQATDDDLVYIAESSKETPAAI
jgi:2-isopropylmalate synthase